jgi:hypothetical protein
MMKKGDNTMRKYIIFSIFLVIGIIPFIYSEKEGKEKDELSPEHILQNMKSYQEIVERISGRKFKAEVQGKIQSVEEFREFVKKELDKYFNEQGKYTQLALSKLGLIPEDYNLRKGLEDLVVSQGGAYYNPATKCMYIVKVNMPSLAIETMLIHELTHALQDQYYDLDKILKQAQNDDTETALKYLIEGEATYVMTIGQLEKMGITFAPDSPMLQKIFDRMKKMSRKAVLDSAMINAESLKNTAPDLFNAIIGLKEVPPYLFWTLYAPYYQGAYSIHKLITFDAKQRNWEIIDRIYQNPPVSTEQMLHINKLIKKRDEPTTISRPSLEKGWDVLSENTLGEFGFWVLYDQYTQEDATVASEGWGGDKYFLVQYDKTGDIVLYLSTAWDSDKDAEESFKAYQKVISKKYLSAEIKKQEKDPGKTNKITYTTYQNKLIILTLTNNTWTAIEEIPSGMEIKQGE